MSAFPIVCFLVLSAFLGCLGLFALAVTKVAAPDGRGHARGFVGGCAAMLALFLLCGLGLAGLAATVAAIGVGSVSAWNPIRHVEITRGHARSDGHGADVHGTDANEERAVSARFTVRGDGGGELLELVHALAGVDLAALGDGLTIQPRTGPDGEEFSVYEFHLPISEAELERFERDVRRELDGLDVHLPEKVSIEFEGAGRD